MTTHIKDDFGNDWYFEDAQYHADAETAVTTGDPCRDALQAIIDWADFVLRNKETFESHHSALMLTGPAFDRARAVLADPPVHDLYEALQPFAKVYQHDIGTDEADGDLFQVINNNRAPKLTVEDFKRAYNACWERSS